MASAETQRTLRARLGPHLDEFFALSCETSQELFSEGLLQLGQRLENDGRLEDAFRIYSALSEGPLASRARARSNALTGRGEFGGRFEFLLRRTAEEALRPQMLLAMGAAGLAFRTTRLVLNARLMGSLRNPLVRHGLANAGGFLAETLAFTGTERLAPRGMGSHQGSGEAWIQSWAEGAAMLLGLRTVGGLSALAARRLSRGSDYLASFLQSTLVPGGTIAGIYAGNRLTEALGLRESHADGTRLSDALATYLQFRVSGRLLHSLTGGRLQALERSLDIRTEGLQRSPLLEFPRPSLQRGRLPASWLAAGSGLLTLLGPLRAMAQTGVMEGRGEPTLHQAGFEWFHLLEAGALAGGAWYAYDGILRIRASLLARSSVSDPKALEQLAGMARPGSRTYVLQLLAGLAEQNSEAVFALHAVGLRFGNRRFGTTLLEGLNTERLFSQVLADPQVLDALILLAGLGNRSARTGLTSIDLSSWEERAQTNPDLALGLASLATQYGNLSSLGILKGMNTPELIRRGAGDWKALPPLILQGITGNRSAMEFLQDFDPVPVLEATSSEDLATAIERALLPIGMLGNEAARRAFRGLDPELLRDSVPQNFQLVQDLVFIAEWGNSRAESVLAEVGESYPLAVSNLALLARYGHKIAQNLLMHLNPSHLIQNAPVDPWAFYAMVELAHAGNRRAQEGLLQHLRLYPRSQPMVAEITASNFQHPAVGGIFQALQEICQFSISEFSKLNGTRQMDFIRRFWTRWQELPKPRRLEYFQRDQRMAMNSLVPLSWILEEGRKEGWKVSREMREFLPNSPKPPSRPKKKKRR